MHEQRPKPGRTTIEESFDLFFAEYAGRVRGYLMGRGLEGPAAEELTQEVMLTVWRKSELYDPARASLGTWIFTIARNKLIDLHRRRRRPEPDPQDPCWVPAAARQAAPDDQLSIQERDVRLRKALFGLSEEHRRTLELLYFEGLSMLQVAERMQVPLGTVKSRARRAMAGARQALQDEEDHA